MRAGDHRADSRRGTQADDHREDSRQGTQADAHRADSNQGTEAGDQAAKAGVRQAAGHKAAVRKVATAHKAVRRTEKAPAARSKAKQRSTRQSLSPSKPQHPCGHGGRQPETHRQRLHWHYERGGLQPRQPFVCTRLRSANA
jgi:hypothetical protein